MTSNEGDVAPDLPLTRTRARPAHRDPGLIALIVAGGAVGTTVRNLLENAFPTAPGHWPWATFGINVTGAFILGLLLEVLSRSGPDAGWRRRVRLTVGTGVLGGYTTYSTFAVEVAGLTTDAPHVLGAAYAVASVVLGVLGAAGGYLLAVRAVKHAWRPT